MSLIKKKITESLKKVLDSLNYHPEFIEVISSNRKDLCDYQYDGSFGLAKIYHKSPILIANEIVDCYQQVYKENPLLSNIEAVNGFINFTLSDEIINEILNRMNTQAKFAIELPEPKTIVIDYGGPNIAKPLHVGHLRSAIVGESIKRMLKFLNYHVISDVHLGDYGLQIGEVIYGLEKEHIELNAITLEKLETIYPQMNALCKEDESIREKCAKITKEMQEGNPIYQEYFKVIRKISGNDILRIYNYLGVSFDYWYGESDAYPYIPETTQLLKAKQLLVKSENALVVPVSEEEDKKEIPPFIYQKSNGAYLYGTTDLATIVERIKDFNPDDIIYVTDSRQSMHFTSLFRVCKKLGLTPKLEHLGFGTVNGLDGKPFKTREGNSPKLDSLFKETKEIFLTTHTKNNSLSSQDLDILVNAIIKFADLQNNREKDYIFDLKKFSMVVGKTGPYILYTYLRTNSVLKKEKINEGSLTTIYNTEDRALRMKLLELEDIINYAVETRLPSVIANFIYELSVNMNAFYEKNHINNLEDLNKKNNWLILLNLTNKVLKTMLDLLSIEIPEKM